MKKINIKHTVGIIAFLVTFLLTFDLAIGSYQESEPHAGNILFGACAVILAVAVALYFKFKPCIFKKN